MKPNPPTKQAARLPKPRVMYYSVKGHYAQTLGTNHCCNVGAFIPTHKPSEARSLIRVAGFFARDPDDQIGILGQVIAHNINAHGSAEKTAKVVLTLIASGGARK